MVPSLTPQKTMSTTSKLSAEASNSDLAAADQRLMELIRYEGPLAITQLCERMSVTATAIRQRLTRLIALGLVERVESKQKRGRPVHLYRLSEKGLEAIGNNLADLAEALWLEVLQIDDASVRQSVIDGVLNRLIERYREEVSGDTLTERLSSIASLFRKRRIPFVVENLDEQAAMRIVGCPYPKLNDHNDAICQFEQRLVSELLDEPVAMSHCQCDSSGGQCCTFSAAAQQDLSQVKVQEIKIKN